MVDVIVHIRRQLALIDAVTAYFPEYGLNVVSSMLWKLRLRSV